MAADWEDLVALISRLVHGRDALEERWRRTTAARGEALVAAARRIDDAGLWHLTPAFTYAPAHPAHAAHPQAPGRWGGADGPRARPLEAERLRRGAARGGPAADSGCGRGEDAAGLRGATGGAAAAPRPALAAAGEAELPLYAWRARLRRREVSAEELARAVLERIERLDPQVRAFVTVPRERVLAEARQADAALRRGRPGPLTGLPVAIKDIIDVGGLPTTAGSRIMEGCVAARDAAVVARLRTAGAVVVGKTATHEFAFGTTTDTPYHGPVHNPWAPERSAGGSSGGSGAAVAARMVPAAVGTDTAGSIRIPAAACGVVGLMPTYGRVGRSGVVPLSWSCDHVGPLALTVADAALLLASMAGADAGDPATGPHSDQGVAGLWQLALAAAESARAGMRPLAGLRVGVPEAWLHRIEPDVEAAFWRALVRLEELGAALLGVELPPLDVVRLANRLIVLAEAGALHAGTLARRAADYSDPVRARIELGQVVLARDYLLAQRLRGECARAVAAAMREADLLALPTLPVPAPPLGQEAWEWPDGPEPVPDALIRLTQGFNVTGQPVLSLPCGFTREGLPVGLQLAARPFEEGALVRAGAALEAALGLAPSAPEG